ncbi:MAG: restriction endonuclease subunit S [Spirochaetia bacterium]|jgi:type I restriction enzyme S subunit
MNAWPVKSLEHLIVRLENGARPKGGVSGIPEGVLSIGGEHLNDKGGFQLDNAKFIPEDFFNSIAKGVIQPDDILIVKDGATTGKTAFVGKDFPHARAAINEHVFLLRVDGKQALPKFIFYFLFGPLGRAQVLSSFRGAAIGGIGKDFVRRVQIPLPRLSEQERIVSILEEADLLRRVRAHVEERTHGLIESLYLNTFWQSKDQKAWSAESVADLAEKRDGSIRTGPFGSQLLHSEFEDKGIPVLGIDNVVANDFRWTTARCISPEKFKQFERFRVFPGDVLVTIMGTVGRVSVAPDDLPLCISTKHLCVITPDRSKINPYFLWAALLFDPEVQRQKAGIGNGAIMEGWNSTIIRQLTLYLPPLALQHTFVAYIAEIVALKRQQAANRKLIEDLFDSLLSRAFRGDL